MFIIRLFRPRLSRLSGRRRRRTWAQQQQRLELRLFVQALSLDASFIASQYPSTCHLALSSFGPPS